VTHATKEEAVGKLLLQLSGLCDTGFALAVHIRYTRPSLLYRTYSQKWIEHYSERGFMLSDPVVHWGLNNIGTVEWADLTDHDPANVIRDALAHGLTNGWTFSFGPATSRTIAGLTKSGAPFADEDRNRIIRIVEEIHALTDGIEAFPANTQDALRSLG
jgi:LuxR family transcriptional regulator, quorum-sensing system regulator SdiA